MNRYAKLSVIALGPISFCVVVFFSGYLTGKKVADKWWDARMMSYTSFMERYEDEMEKRYEEWKANYSPAGQGKTLDRAMFFATVMADDTHSALVQFGKDAKTVVVTIKDVGRR